MNLTIGYITARFTPCVDWFLKSLYPQLAAGDHVNVIVVDSLQETRGLHFPENVHGVPVRHVLPKPTVWQGKHRLTKVDYWAVSNARNTAICLCETEWITFLDDRSVLMPGWLDSIREAMRGNYAVCGRYEKRHDMQVDAGMITLPGRLDGKDPRFMGSMVVRPCPGNWFFGCNTALPMEWALKIGGYAEDCDSLGLEDCIFGEMLMRNRLPIKYDPRMFMVEDRTPSQIEPPTCKRTDKGVSPWDKSHALVDIFASRLTSCNRFDIRQVRQDALAGKLWPIPTEPRVDFYDGQALSEFT